MASRVRAHGILRTCCLAWLALALPLCARAWIAGQGAARRERPLVAFQEQQWQSTSSIKAQKLSTALAGFSIAVDASAIYASLASAPAPGALTPSPSAADAIGAPESSQVLTAQYQPGNGSLDGQAFSMFFRAALANTSIAGVQVKPGSYEVNTTATCCYHIVLDCRGLARPFFVTLAGANLTFQKADLGFIMLDQCSDLTLQGPATLDMATAALPITQGRVASIVPATQPSESLLTIAMDPGFPSLDLMTTNATLLGIPYDDATGDMASNTSDVALPPYVGTAIVGGKETFTFLVSNLQNVSQNQSIAIRGARGNHGIAVISSSGVVVQQMHLHTAGLFAFLDASSNASKYDRNSLTPRPTPYPGTSRKPLLSGAVDGIHITQATHGATIVNNILANMGDDGIAMEGAFYLIAATNSTALTLTLTTITYRMNLQPGDALRLYRNTTEFIGSANVLAVEEGVPAPANVSGYSVTAVNQSFSYDGAVYWRVTLDYWGAKFDYLTFDDLASDTSQQGSQYLVANNTVHSNRGRGAVLKSSNGVILGNSFVNNKLTGVLVQPDFQFLEGDFVRNLSVSGNMFQTSPAGVFIGSLVADGTPSPWDNQQLLAVSNNRFLDIPYAPLILTSATNVLVYRNYFSECSCQPAAAALLYGSWYEPGTPVYLYNVNGGMVSANYFNVDFFDTAKECQFLNSSALIAINGQSSGVDCC